MRIWVYMVSAAVVAGGVATQEAGPYKAQPEPVVFESVNDYMLWFLQGSDTAGQPITTTTVETHDWSASRDGLSVHVILSGEGFSSETTYEVEPSGRVVTVDGVQVADVEGARVDLLPRLQAGVLEVGMTWMDEVSASAERDYGDTSYHATRRYEVDRVAEVAGTEVLVVVSTGELRLRQGGWQDTNQTSSWWQEVSGPVVDTVWFDPEAGRLVADATHMVLSGEGGVSSAGGSVSLPSGLRSSVRRTSR